MATTARLLLPSPYYSCASIFFHTQPIPSSSSFNPHTPKTKTMISSFKSQVYTHSSSSLLENDNLGLEKMEKIQEIHCIEAYDKTLQYFSQENLVIAHFSVNHYTHNSKIQFFMKRQCSNEVKFMFVMANESEKTREICRREKIEKIPHFIFYRNGNKIHEEAGFEPEKLVRNMVYHRGDPFSSVVRLQSVEDLEKLKRNHDQMIVLFVGKKHECIPCVKMYPSVDKLANEIGGEIVFARMDCDENDGCMNMLREMEVLRVPTFLFFKNGDLCGRYVGSCITTLVKEMVKFT